MAREGRVATIQEKTLAALKKEGQGYEDLWDAIGREHCLSSIQRALLALEKKGLAKRVRVYHSRIPRADKVDFGRCPRVLWSLVP
jgi:hypothetical protein